MITKLQGNNSENKEHLLKNTAKNQKKKVIIIKIQHDFLGFQTGSVESRKNIVRKINNQAFLAKLELRSQKEFTAERVQKIWSKDTQRVWSRSGDADVTSSFFGYLNIHNLIIFLTVITKQHVWNPAPLFCPKGIQTFALNCICTHIAVLFPEICLTMWCTYNLHWNVEMAGFASAKQVSWTFSRFIYQFPSKPSMLTSGSSVNNRDKTEHLSYLNQYMLNI